MLRDAQTKAAPTGSMMRSHGIPRHPKTSQGQASSDLVVRLWHHHLPVFCCLTEARQDCEAKPQSVATWAFFLKVWWGGGAKNRPKRVTFGSQCFRATEKQEPCSENEPLVAAFLKSIPGRQLTHLIPPPN